MSTDNRLISATKWLQAIADDIEVPWKSRMAAGELVAALEGQYSDPPDLALEWLEKQTKRRDFIHRSWAIHVQNTLADFGARDDRPTVEMEPYFAPKSGEVSHV